MGRSEREGERGTLINRENEIRERVADIPKASLAICRLLIHDCLTAGPNVLKTAVKCVGFPALSERRRDKKGEKMKMISQGRELYNAFGQVTVKHVHRMRSPHLSRCGFSECHCTM